MHLGYVTATNDCLSCPGLGEPVDEVVDKHSRLPLMSVHFITSIYNPPSSGVYHESVHHLYQVYDIFSYSSLQHFSEKLPSSIVILHFFN